MTFNAYIFQSFFSLTLLSFFWIMYSTAYNMFFKDRQDEINQMKLRYTHTTVNAARVVSNMWKKLKPHIKAEYHKRAMQDKFRYYNEKAAYNRAVAQQVAAARHARVMSNNHALPEHQVPAYPAMTNRQAPFMQSASTLQSRESSCTGSSYDGEEAYVPPYSKSSMARLASRLDAQSIDFLIKALQ